MVEIGATIKKGIYERKVVAIVDGRVYAKDDMGIVYVMNEKEIKGNWKEVGK